MPDLSDATKALLSKAFADKDAADEAESEKEHAQIDLDATKAQAARDVAAAQQKAADTAQAEVDATKAALTSAHDALASAAKDLGFPLPVT